MQSLGMNKKAKSLSRAGSKFKEKLKNNKILRTNVTCSCQSLTTVINDILVMLLMIKKIIRIQ